MTFRELSLSQPPFYTERPLQKYLVTNGVTVSDSLEVSSRYITIYISLSPYIDPPCDSSFFGPTVTNCQPRVCDSSTYKFLKPAMCQLGQVVKTHQKEHEV
jgi:hypothetical protein